MESVMTMKKIEIVTGVYMQYTQEDNGSTEYKLILDRIGLVAGINWTIFSQKIDRPLEEAVEYIISNTILTCSEICINDHMIMGRLDRWATQPIEKCLRLEDTLSITMDERVKHFYITMIGNTLIIEQVDSESSTKQTAKFSLDSEFRVCGKTVKTISR